MSTHDPYGPQHPIPSTPVGLGVIALVMWALIGLVVAAAFLPHREDGDGSATTTQEPTTVRIERADQAVSADVRNQPVRLTVQRIGVDTALMPLGLTTTGELEVPPLAKAGIAGWYDRSPVPGDVGPAVLAGHVDSSTGPAVFFRLKELDRGDRIVVDRSDGARATFAVDGVEEVPKDAFPTQRVYGATPRAELRLITCGGDFDAESGHYLSNVVVFAHLIDLT